MKLRRVLGTTHAVHATGKRLVTKMAACRVDASQRCERTEQVRCVTCVHFRECRRFRGAPGYAPVARGAMVFHSGRG